MSNATDSGSSSSVSATHLATNREKMKRKPSSVREEYYQTGEKLAQQRTGLQLCNIDCSRMYFSRREVIYSINHLANYNLVKIT